MKHGAALDGRPWCGNESGAAFYGCQHNLILIKYLLVGSLYPGEDRSSPAPVKAAPSWRPFLEAQG